MTKQNFDKTAQPQQSQNGFIDAEHIVKALPAEVQNTARFSFAATGVKGLEIVMIDDNIWGGGGVSDGYGLSIRDPEEEEETKFKVERPLMYKVIFHNDDETTFDYVWEVLQKFFNKQFEEAEAIAAEIHLQEYAIVAVLPKVIAEKKVADVNNYSRQTPNPVHGGPMQLKVTCEPD